MTRSELMKVIEETLIESGLEEDPEFAMEFADTVADRLEMEFGLIDEEEEPEPEVDEEEF